MKQPLKFAFFGSSLVSAFWNGAATYYRGIIKALHKKGHSITFYEPDIYDRQKNRDIERIDYATSVVYIPDTENIKRCMNNAKKCDVIIKTSGVGAFDEYLEEAVLDQKTIHNLVIFWDVDAPATLERLHKNQNDPFKRMIPNYDTILTYGGGIPVVRNYLDFGAKSCHPIYNALDPDTHFRVPVHTKFDATIGFLGNRLPDREERVNEFFLYPAKRLSGKAFIIGGNGWEYKFNDQKNIKNMGHIFTHDHNRFNSSTTFVLNINRNSMARYGYSPPTRIFEAAGAKACIICDEWNGIEQFLAPGTECLVARNGDHVADFISMVHKKEAETIGAAAYERIINEHTYEQRVKDVERILTELFDQN
jgi:spore maturation protein CgeB